MVERIAGSSQYYKKVDITKESLKKILGRMPKWKSPGLDVVKGF